MNFIKVTLVVNDTECYIVREQIVTFHQNLEDSRYGIIKLNGGHAIATKENLEELKEIIGQKTNPFFVM